MLRSIFLRNQVISENLKQTVRVNIVRCVNTELSRRRNFNKPSVSSSKNKYYIPQWEIQVRSYDYIPHFPSHTKVLLPALSPTMETGSIASWAKKEGDQLNEGDLLCEIETDKATMGFETPEEGFLAKILIPAGTKGVPVGKLLCIIVESADAVAAFKDFKATDDAVPAPAAAAAPAPPAPGAAPPAPAKASAPGSAAAAPADGGRVYASPFARRIAELKDIRLGGKGSGLYGSLKSGDLDASAAGAKAEARSASAAPPPPSAGDYEDIPLSNMRSVIAKRLTAAKQTIPHYQLSVTVNIEKTLAARKALNDKLAAKKENTKVSMNDFIVKAVAAACKRVPAVNAHWMDTYIRQFSSVDISVAVATPAGLITPILFNADSRGVLELSRNMKELAARAREGGLQPHEYQGGTVTISNLGMYGITMFNAIINPPQALILACGGIQELVIPDKESFRLAKFATFTASADHRVIDGAVGAQWMSALKDNLEDPVNIIL